MNVGNRAVAGAKAAVTSSAGGGRGHEPRCADGQATRS